MGVERRIAIAEQRGGRTNFRRAVVSWRRA